MADNKGEKEGVSKHILPAASTLLGLCFVLLGFMKAIKFTYESVIDEFVMEAIVLFAVASFFSYVSVRSDKRAKLYERTADIIFLAVLIFISLLSVIISFEMIR